MKKKIEQLLGGKFEYEQPELVFSPAKLVITLNAGEIKKGEVHLGAENNRSIRGYVTSSDGRLVPETTKFQGTAVCLAYQVNGMGMRPGDEITGWLCFTTNIGEYKLPFIIGAQCEEIRTSEGQVKNLEEFCKIAKNDFGAAYNLFRDKSFPSIMSGADKRQQAMYAGFSRGAVTYQHLEEFLIGMGQKDPVYISLKTKDAEYYEIAENIRESFVIQRSGWGHLRLEIECRGEFLEISKQAVTDDDFIGSTYRVDYIVHSDRMGRGIRNGEIIVRSPYQEVVYHVLATRNSQAQVNVRSVEKRCRLDLYRRYIDYRSGQCTREAWAEESCRILQGLVQEGFDYPEFHLMEAYVLYQEGRLDAAKNILQKYQDRTFTVDELELAGAYLYLCTITGMFPDREQALNRIQEFFMQKEDSFLLFYLNLRMDKVYEISPVQAVYQMKQQFDRGCINPLLYQEAWDRISADTSLLHRLGGFWAQVFYYAAKRNLLTEELVNRAAYLSNFEKSFNRTLYRVLSMGYEKYPSEDVLEAICKYIMKDDPRKPEYFQWYSLAVEQGLRLTRLYEYYVETMDTSYQQEMPKPLLMYFTYNDHTLGEDKKAYLYAGIVSRKDHDPDIYQSCRDAMRAFAVRGMEKGCLDENHAVLYQEFFSEPENMEEARAMTDKLFACRLYCDNSRIHQVVVRHSQMEREEVYPCRRGIAFPRIYTSDAVILFQDDKQRRYTATVDYNITPLIDGRELVPRLLKMGVEDPGLLLHYCENNPIQVDNLEIFQKLSGTFGLTDTYRKSVRRDILNYYASNAYGEDLDEYLKNMDYSQYALVDLKTLLEVLISRRLFLQAAELVSKYGYEQLEENNLLKLTSRMILDCQFEEDGRLLSWASRIYRQGKYDETVLRYLMQYRFGPVDELSSIWKSAKGFDMDTYDLEEKLLSLLMFTCDYRKDGEQILEAYVKQSGKERIIGAYLTQVSYGIFVKEYPMSAYVKQRLKYAYDNKWPVNRICRMALLKSISKEKDAKGKYYKMKEELLAECRKDGLVFSFFRKLPMTLLSPYQLDDKVFVEYHTNPSDKVILHYALDTGLGDERIYKSEPLKDTFEGIFTKTFTLFYGESLHYYFVVKGEAGVKKTSERVITMNKAEGTPMSKYQLLNQIMAARRLGRDEEVLKKMRQYLRQEQYVNEMFVIEKESEK